MKALTSAACAAILALGSALAGGEGWTHDFEAARKQAAEEDKDLLIDFTGSDWCGWCIRLNDEVFKHDAFKEGVKDRYILVELDFPQDKSKLSEETRKQNAELGEKYGVRGYPTILLADPEGRPYARTGYQQGGPEKYVAHLGELQKAKAGRDEAITAAAELEGAEKAGKLVTAIEAMGLEDAMVASFYGGLIEQIKEADPDDASGFVKKIEDNRRFAEFESKLNGFGMKQDHEGAMGLVEETLAEGGFEGEQQQQVTLIKAMIHTEMGQFDEAIATLELAREAAPDSPAAGQIDRYKQMVEQRRTQVEGAAEDAAEGAAEGGESSESK